MVDSPSLNINLAIYLTFSATATIHHPPPPPISRATRGSLLKVNKFCVPFTGMLRSSSVTRVQHRGEKKVYHACKCATHVDCYLVGALQSEKYHKKKRCNFLMLVQKCITTSPTAFITLLRDLSISTILGKRAHARCVCVCC